MFNPQPKPQPKEKNQFGFEYWNAIRAKSAKKKSQKMKPTVAKDNEFYEFIWKKKNPKFCLECASVLPEKWGKINFHHLIPKSKMPYFRHEEKNIVILCGSCHAKAESAVSYPKMKIYEWCEHRKKELLESVGLN